MKRSKEQQIKADNMFDELRDLLLTRDLSNTENYDKAILTLSASSLGLSLTAIKFVVPLETALYLPLLITSWGLLVVSVISSLIAFIISNKAISVQLENARDYYKKGIEDAFSRGNKYIKFNSFLNYLTGLSFAFAILLIVIFISINLNNGENNMCKESKENAHATIPLSASIPDIENIPNADNRSANIPTIESVSPTLDPGTSANIPEMEPAPSTNSPSDENSSDN